MSGRFDSGLRWGIAFALMLAGGVVWARAGAYGQGMVAEIAIFAMFAMAVDLVGGLVGLMSIGHAMYFGFGAYVVAFLTTSTTLGAGAATLVSVAGALALGAMVGGVIVRFGEITFIMLSLALAEMVYAFVFGNRALGGSDGIAGVSRLDLSAVGLDTASPATFTVLVLLAAFASFALLDTMTRSPFGLVAAAVRQNPVRARALGTPLNRVRMVAYAISAALAAGAGALLAQLNGFVSPDLAGWTLSGLVLIMAVLGGLGSISGAALGAVVIQTASHYVSRLTGYWGFFLGLLLIAVVLFAENGIFALLRRAVARIALVRRA